MKSLDLPVSDNLFRNGLRAMTGFALLIWLSLPVAALGEVTWQVQSDYFAERNEVAQPRTTRSMALSHDGQSVYTGLIQSATAGGGVEGGSQSVRKVFSNVLAGCGTDAVIFGNGMPGGDTISGWDPVGDNPVYDGNSDNCEAGSRNVDRDLTGGTCDGPFEAWTAFGSNSSPRGLATDDRGNLYVALRDRNDVRILNSDMTEQLSREDITPTDPTGVAVLNDDGTYFAYVASGNLLQRWNVTDPEDPVLDAGWSAPGVTAGAENLTVDDDGTVFLAGGGQVRRISPDGQTITHSFSLANAADVAVFQDKAYVIQRTQTNVITVLNKADLTQVDELEVPDFPGTGPDGDCEEAFERGSIHQFTAIDIDPVGRIFVSEENYTSGNNGIPAYTPPVTSFNPEPNEITGRIYFDRVLVSSPVPPVVVYVDHEFSTNDFGDPVTFEFPDGTQVNATFGVDAFDTISDGVATVAEDGIVHVAAGTYGEDVEVGTTGLSLRGPNAGLPGWDDEARWDEAIIEGQVVLGADGAILDGFEVSPPPATDNQEAEAVRVSNTPNDVRVQNNVVRDFSEDGLPEWIGIDGINVFGGSATEAIENVSVIDNLVLNISGRETNGGAAGISIQGNVSGAEVTGNHVLNVGMAQTAWAFGIVVRDTGNHAENPSNVTVADNVIDTVLSNPASGTRGVGMGLEGGVADFHGNVLGNTEWQFEDKTDAGAAFLEEVLSQNTFDRVVVVRDNPITVPILFANIQDAIDAASAGDLIDVSAGTYEENIIIPNALNGLTLSGAKSGIPAGPDSVPVDRFADESVIVGQVHWQTGTGPTDVTIDGFTIEAVDDSSITLWVRDVGALIVNNIFVGQGDGNTSHIGIRASSNQGDHQIANNRVVDFERGMELDGNPSDDPSTFAGNYLSGNSSGIFTFGSYPAANTYTGNHFDNNDFGMTLLRGQNIEGNNFTDNNNAGIRFAFSPDISNSLISDNDFSGNGRGIWFLDSSGTTADNVVVVGNRIFDNTDGFVSELTASIKASCNWWGDENGPSGDGPGGGDTVSGEIEFAPWSETSDAESPCEGGILLEVTPEFTLDLGEVLVDETSDPDIVTLANSGFVTVEIESITAAFAPFARSNGNCAATPFELVPGQSCTIEYTFSPDEAGAKAQAITIRSNAPSDPDTVTLVGTGVDEVNLVLSGQVDTEPAVGGTEITYTLEVENRDGVTATGIKIETTLPGATTLVASTGCDESPDGGVPTCTIGELDGKSTTQVELTVEVDSGADPAEDLVFDAVVSGDQADSNPELNEVQIVSGVTLEADLTLVKAGDAIQVSEDLYEVVFVIVVENNGPSDAEGATVIDDLPAVLTNVEWTCDAEGDADCPAAGTGALDEQVDLPAGDSVTFEVTAEVSREDFLDGFTNEAEVIPPENVDDPNLDNNTDSVTIMDRVFHDRFEDN